MTSSCPTITFRISARMRSRPWDTLSATAANHYLATRQPSPNAIAHAAVHGYATAYWWAGAIFIAGAAIAGLLLHRPSEHEVETDLELVPVAAL